MALAKEQYQTIAGNFQKAFPEYCFIVANNQFWFSGFTGHKLVDHQNLRTFKLAKNKNSPNITNDQLKEICFVWVYDSKSVNDGGQRRDILKEKLGNKLKGYNVIVLLGSKQFPFAVRGAKAWCQFKKSQYNHQIIVVVS